MSYSSKDYLAEPLLLEDVEDSSVFRSNDDKEERVCCTFHLTCVYDDDDDDDDDSTTTSCRTDSLLQHITAVIIMPLLLAIQFGVTLWKKDNDNNHNNDPTVEQITQVTISILLFAVASYFYRTSLIEPMMLVSLLPEILADMVLAVNLWSSGSVWAAWQALCVSTCLLSVAAMLQQCVIKIIPRGPLLNKWHVSSQVEIINKEKLPTMN